MGLSYDGFHKEKEWGKKDLGRGEIRACVREKEWGIGWVING